MPVDPNDENLSRLCELQELQLKKLDEIAKQLAESTESARQTHEEFVRQGAAYEQSLKAYQTSERLLAKVVTWRAVLIALMLALIAFAIFMR